MANTIPTAATSPTLKTVMIVDDVAFVRRTLAEIFSDAGYQIVGEAEDGLRAVEMYAALRPQLVTMDIVMPQMSGIEAARKILKADPGARIVIISAMGQENLVMDAINVGARDYLLKPFSSEEVLKTAERALGDEPPAFRPASANRGPHETQAG